MAPMRQAWIVAIGLAALAAGPLFADTVVLANGARVTGEVRVGHNTVTVLSADGELVLPLSRVQSIERGMQGQPAAKDEMREGGAAPEPAESAPARQEAAPPGAEAAPRVSRATDRGRVPRVRDVLAQRIDIDFEGVPVADVLVYLRELTGVNMALAPEVNTDPTTVTLHLRNVRIEEILDLALEPSGLRYTVRPGEILYVYAGGGAEMVLRVYPVADLLLSTADRRGGDTVSLGGGTGNAGGGSLGSGTRDGGGLNPQFGLRQGGSQLQNGGAGSDEDTEQTELAARADALIFLIKNTCGRGTWEDPAGTGLIDADSGL